MKMTVVNVASRNISMKASSSRTAKMGGESYDQTLFRRCFHTFHQFVCENHQRNAALRSARRSTCSKEELALSTRTAHHSVQVHRLTPNHLVHSM